MHCHWVKIPDEKASHEANLQLICCPIGSPKTDVGVGRANLNLATLWLSSVRLTSLNSLKFSGSKQSVKTSAINKFASRYYGLTIYIGKT